MRKKILELDDGKKWQMYRAYQDIADQRERKAAKASEDGVERGDIKETSQYISRGH